MDLYEATEWVTQAVEHRVVARMAADPRRNRLREVEEAWSDAQRAVETLMAVGGPEAVSPQTSLLVAPQPR